MQDASPRLVVGGPLIEGRLYFAQTVLYDLQKLPNRTLPFPDNTSKQERINSFTQLDYILSSKQYLTATLHLTPQHIDFVNPDFFNPQRVTPSYRQQDYLGTVTDHLSVGHGMLESAVSIQRFDAAVGSQGSGEMFILPQGNQGNYFANQNREAGRIELTETWSPAAIHDGGTHELKFGVLATHTSDAGLSTAKPINIEDASGLLLQRIDFTGGAPAIVTTRRGDHPVLSGPLVAQARTVARSRDAPGAAEHLGRRFRIAPRAGLSWEPFGGEQTVVQAGYGIFYDRVPLGVYAFDRFPQRVVTNYAPDGTLLGPPIAWLNLTGYAATANSLLIHTENQPGNFAPHSGTWNVHIEHMFSPNVRIRAGYTDSQSSGLVLLDPVVTQGTNALVLNGSGHSRYRAAEITAKVAWKGGQWFLAYTRSRSQGDLNDFSGFLGNYPLPLVRLRYLCESRLPDLPNQIPGMGLGLNSTSDTGSADSRVPQRTAIFAI